jgi:hypothetical protein
MLLQVRIRKCAASENEFASEVVWRIPITIRAALGLRLVLQWRSEIL